MEFEIIHNPAGVHATKGYAHAARLGDILFVSGQVAQNEQGEIVGRGDPEAQVEQIFKNLQAVLAASGSSLERVGKINILSTSMDYLPAAWHTPTTWSRSRRSRPLARRACHGFRAKWPWTCSG
jgi:enamine deaminase RidA (YjgF/YER057c/UK114 family)